MEQNIVYSTVEMKNLKEEPIEMKWNVVYRETKNSKENPLYDEAIN